jgi:enamine deaminase RidA (YjgF/YER057c/UK114 family)
VLPLKSLKPLGHASAAIAVGQRVYLSALYGKSAAEVQQKLKRTLAEIKGAAVLTNEYGTVARAPIAMQALPAGAPAALSVIALRNAAGKPASQDVCRADGKTIFCQVQAACACDDLDLPAEVGAVFKLLEKGLAKHGATLAHAVATNVYLNDITEFRPMNETYATFFAAAPPTRTTVQPFAKGQRTAEGPPSVRISLVAVMD